MSEALAIDESQIPDAKPTALDIAAKPDDWRDSIPEKYRVKNAEGVLDMEATAPKLVHGYNELMKRMVAGEAPPADEEGYEVKDLPHGIDFAELKKDPEFSSWLKGAHSKGMSNAHIQHAMEGLSKFIVGDVTYTQGEAVTELRKVWVSDAEYSANGRAAERAAKTVAARLGVPYEELSNRYGNDPLYIRAMAVFGREMAEDTAPPDGGNVPSDIEDQIKAKRAELELMPMSDRNRPAKQAALLKLYEMKTESGSRKAGAFTD